LIVIYPVVSRWTGIKDLHIGGEGISFTGMELFSLEVRGKWTFAVWIVLQGNPL